MAVGKTKFACAVAVSLVSAGFLVALSLVLGAPPPPPPPPPPGGPAGPPPAPAPVQVPGLGVPLAGLDSASLASFRSGARLFGTPANPPQGLGPVFTENSCQACHRDGAPGGSGRRLVTRIGAVVNGVFDPLLEYGGPSIQNNGIGVFHGVNFVGEVVPKQATIVAERRTIPLFGLGLVDAIPAEAIQNLASQQQSFMPLTAGQVSIVVDAATGNPSVGKFGWKAQEPTLQNFVADAMTNELGVTNPIFPSENCPQGNCALLAANPALNNPNDPNGAALQQFTFYVLCLAPPPRGPSNPSVVAGQAIFANIGCANCHTPTWETGLSPIAPLNNVTFSPFSDFLLHDMGSLGDGIVQNQAGPHQMRTAPLWGLRFEGAYLHDGRAETVAQAILAHDGQGQLSRNAFASLTAGQQAQLLAFLNSL